MDRSTALQERMLEDDSHNVVNNEDIMYDNIDAIPMNSEDVVNQILKLSRTMLLRYGPHPA